MHQFGWLSERGGNFLNLLQKEGVSKKRGFPQKRGASNPGENYEVFAEFSKLGRSFLYCSDRSNS